MLNLLIIVVFIVQLCTYISDADVIVSLPKGDIRGSELFAYNNTPYYAFQQVPFAAPPVGKLRFQPPVEPESWNGTLNATESTKICYQWNSNNARQTEDCLYLNVYTPVKPGASANKSVIVFFYGGAFLTGSYRYEIYPPEYYIYHDVVVVVPNYRIGPFGFLSTQDTTIPGNYGLKDQLFSLQWVQKNIHLFGGDPTKVTINGQSAGAASVGYHLVSKKSAGLFRGAILESGSVLSSYAIQRYAKKIAHQLAQKINANFTTNNTSEELLSLLQNTSADTINGISLPDLFGVQLGQGSTFSPVIEPKHDGAFITDFMHESLRNGDFNVVPAIIGINSEERIFEAADLNAFKALMTQYDDDLKLIVNDDFNVSDENKQIVGEKLRQIYTDGKFQDNLGAAIRFKSDVRYSTCIVRHAILQSNYSDVYFYQFSYHGEIAGNEVSIDGADRVQHSEELIYLWPQYGKNVINYPKGDIIAHIRLITLWTNFVKYLNPTPEPVELFENITWPTLKPNNLQYLNINDTLEIKVNPRQYKSWVGIIEEYGNPPFDTF